MVYRLILPDWAKEARPDLKKVLEGEFTDEQLFKFNSEDFYGIFYLPNYPDKYDSGKTVDGSHIDVFRMVFVDMDLKEGVYKSKDEFIEFVHGQGLDPSFIVDSGNGVHVYWEVADLDAMSFLRLQRRLCRLYKTDEAVCKIFQLMRVPGYTNTKRRDDFKPCELIYTTENVYTCEQLDNFLPQISAEDEAYCLQHYEKTYSLESRNVSFNEALPLKFAKLLRDNTEVKDIWSGNIDDRSKADYRLGHIMFAQGFSKEEALSVLVNTAKAMTRAPLHRQNYALNIIDKIWTYEIAEDKEKLDLSSSVKEILSKSGDMLKGTPFPCHSWVDNTKHGFRLGQVIGLVAGSGVGKTAMALNMFEGFVQYNPDYDHFFVALEQPANEIADRWKTLCADRPNMYDKVHVISNYTDDGAFRHLSFDEIREYVHKFQRVTGRKVGCIVIDHIGALKKKGQDGENQDLMTICHSMKAFAVETNTLLVMQSQSSREKAGIGDLELNKDAAYGTVYFESYCDYLIAIWQPLKRMYAVEGCPTVMSFKFCKIRHKKIKEDKIQEDVPYILYFESGTERLREMTEKEEISFNFFNKQATNKRKEDRKTDLVSYKSVNWSNNGETSNNPNPGRTDSA